MDDLRLLAPQIKALEAQPGVDLADYTVVGDNIMLANFEGNYRPDGTRIRQQPWWDKGYTIDIFYLSAFFLGVFLVVKRLPPDRMAAAARRRTLARAASFGIGVIPP